jgi:hypothetical protein
MGFLSAKTVSINNILLIRKHLLEIFAEVGGFDSLRLVQRG